MKKREPDVSVILLDSLRGVVLHCYIFIAHTLRCDRFRPKSAQNAYFYFTHIYPHYSSQSDSTIRDSTPSNDSKGGTLVVPLDLCYSRKTGTLISAASAGRNICLARFASQETKPNISLIVSWMALREFCCGW